MAFAPSGIGAGQHLNLQLLHGPGPFESLGPTRAEVEVGLARVTTSSEDDGPGQGIVEMAARSLLMQGVSRYSRSSKAAAEHIWWNAVTLVPLAGRGWPDHGAPLRMTAKDRGQGDTTVAKPETGEMFSPRMVDSLIDAVVLVDEAGAVLYANPAVERLLGWDVGSLFGDPFATLVPEWHRLAVSPFSDVPTGSETASLRRGPIRTVALGVDGSEIPVDIAFSRVDEHRGPALVIAVIWDASNSIDIERYQRVSEDLLAFLAGASGTGEEIVPQLLAILCSALDFEFATAWRWDPESDLLHCDHAWPGDAREFKALFSASIGTTIHSGEGLPGLVVD